MTTTYSLIEKVTLGIRTRCKITTPLSDYDSFMRQMGVIVRIDYQLPYTKPGAVYKNRAGLIIALARNTLGWTKNITMVNMLGLAVLYLGYELCDTTWQSIRLDKYHYVTNRQIPYVELFTYSLIAPSDEFIYIHSRVPEGKNVMDVLAQRFNVPQAFVIERAKQLALQV